MSGEMGYFERSKSRKPILSRRNINRSSYETPNRPTTLSRKNTFSRPAWMKKLGSPFEQPTKSIKVQTPKSPIQFNPPKSLNIPISENVPSRMLSFKKAKTLPASLNETPNVEHIVQEFESGFTSPRLGIEPGSRNFVKKIVAAFEEKYKSYNDSRSDKMRGKLKDSGLHRHSYSNICQSLHLTPVEISKSTDSLSTVTLSTESSSTKDLKTKYQKSEAPKIQSTIQNQKATSFPKVESQNPPSSGTNQDSTLKHKDRTPVIIGAFLKKPVKVEEISINWIPFPGKKLPRKKSLKKLLSVLRGKKFIEKKKDIVLSSQFNVNEEVRELPDSGYDEQSISSSLTSITSTPEVLPQERIYANCSLTGKWPINLTTFNRRSTNLSTFRIRGQAKADDESDTLSTTSRKLLLYEVPREELKVDLGPCYPAPSRITVKSLDRKVTQRAKIVLPPLPKHPLTSKIPKHPFISLSKDELNEFADDNDEVEFRHPKDNLSSFHSSECDYDVPRKFLSRSEPGISDVLKFTFDMCLDQANYDVPKLRPKSSVYEDALSLKRRNADFSNISGSSQDYYSSPNENEPQFATIRSRNRRYLSPDIFRSNDELMSNSLKVTSF